MPHPLSSFLALGVTIALVQAQQDAETPVRQSALSALQFLWTPAAEAAAVAALRISVTTSSSMPLRDSTRVR